MDPNANFGRTFNEARRLQGFSSQRELDAFYACLDHKAGCAACQTPNAYWSEADACWQACGGVCETEQTLHGAWLESR